MRTGIGFMLMGALVMAVTPTDAAASRQRPALERAFEHYERIRAALAQDTTKGIADEARALSSLAGEVAGDAAGRAATSLAQAKDIAEAREQFGVLSDSLVPKFMDAGLPGVQGFVCSMKKRRWAQRGDAAANPYYGKAMAGCGTPIAR